MGSTTRLDTLNHIDEESIAAFKKRFAELMKFMMASFGSEAFAKYKFEKGGYRKQSSFNAAVYDALMIAVDAEWNTVNQKDKKTVAKAFKELFKNPEFHESVSGSILDSNKVLSRIGRARETLSA